MTPPDGPDVEVAIAAAQAGAAVVAARFGTTSVRFAKQDQDFATDVDLAAEQAILAVIHHARPSDTVVGEESGTTGDATGARRWLVDPLCGTLNFAARTPVFSTNVALLVDGRRAVAAVAQPLTGEVFWSAGRVAGRRHGARDSPLRPSPESGLVNVNVDGPTSGWFVGPQLLADPALRAGFGLRVASSTLALAWVAAGRQAAYVTDGTLADNVHFAAGLALCEATGCTVTDLFGAPVDGGRGAVVAADSDTHAAVFAAVTRVVASRAPGA